MSILLWVKHLKSKTESAFKDNSEFNKTKYVFFKLLYFNLHADLNLNWFRFCL